MTAQHSRYVLLTLCGFVAALATFGCSQSATPLPSDVTTALAAAFTRGDVEACAALYADDAVIISQSAAPIRGKAAIKTFFKEQVARDILFSTDSDASLAEGDLAFDQGSYRVRDTRRGVDVESGQYLNVWRRVHGEWRVLRSMYNVSTSPRAGVSVTTEDESR
jgi:ketosteroid isomerase-like protein